MSELGAHTEVDWSAVAGEVLRRIDRPAFLVDPQARIRAVNELFARLVAASPEALSGSPWDAIVAAPDARRVYGRPIRSSRLEARIRVDAGAEITALLDFSCLGGLEDGWSLVQVVHSHRRWDPAAGSVGARGQTYEVRLQGRDRGALVAIEAPGLAEEAVLGEPCFGALHGRTEPCRRCPVFDGTAGPFRALPPRRDGDPYALVELERSSDGATARVTAIEVEAGAVSRLVEARIDVLAQRGRLAGREREILSLLFLGRSTSEMAMLLDVSERTAKYHQAVVLRKLGVDSRADLVRLLLRSGGPRSSVPPAG